jgi:hypothetical protein
MSGRLTSLFKRKRKKENNGFTSDGSRSPNLNGFIASVADDGGCGEIFYRINHEAEGIWNNHLCGPWFGNYFSSDLSISNNCHQRESFSSKLGVSYGKGPGLNQNALFGQEDFRVIDYEVLKIVIE